MDLFLDIIPSIIVLYFAYGLAFSVVLVLIPYLMKKDNYSWTSYKNVNMYYFKILFLWPWMVIVKMIKRDIKDINELKFKD